MENLEKIDLVYKSKEWYDFRQSGIGMSEVGVLTGWHEWGSPIDMYYEKIGFGSGGFELNERMALGTFTEPNIMDFGRYWDGKETWFKNKIEGKIIRELEPMKDMVFRNKKYSWMFYTPDGGLPAGAKSLLGYTLSTMAPVEAKIIDSLLWDKYGKKVLPGYQHQMTGEQIITESGYGEFWVLVGGNNFQVIPVELNSEYADMVLNAGYNFWHKHVIPGKQLAVEFNNAKPSEKDKIWYEINNYEPPPDSTEAYRKHMVARFAGVDKRIVATPKMEFLMRKYKAIDAVISRLTEAKDLIGNYFRSVHVKEKAMYIDGKDGLKSSFNKKLTISMKGVDTEEYAKRETSKLKFDI